jgi:acetylornithine deacetylase
MKGFDALALAAVPKALAAGVKKPIQIAFSYDEEVGLLGAPGLAAAMNRDLPKASAVIVGEPTEMRVVSGHKGCEGLYVDVTGFEVHSSLLPEGVSAVMTAARLVTWLHDQTQANMAKDPDPIAAMFYPPFTTLHAGIIQGGTAHNITAKDCHFTIDIRCVPSEDIAEWFEKFATEARRVEAEIQAIQPTALIKITRLPPGPGVRPEENGAAEHLARLLTGDNASHTVSYGTDGGHFQAAGYSVCVCGPGNIEQAHKADEFIEIAELEKGEAFLERLVNHLAK